MHESIAQGHHSDRHLIATELNIAATPCAPGHRHVIILGHCSSQWAGEPRSDRSERPDSDLAEVRVDFVGDQSQ